MSVRKTCDNCKHFDHGGGFCCFGLGGIDVSPCGDEMKHWKLSDNAKADLLHDAEPVVTEQVEPTIKTALDKLTTIADSEFEKALEKGAVKLVYEPEHDAVNHPSHYTAGGIECIEALKAATTRLTGIEAVCTANAIKYLWRWKDKNGAEDIRKAIWYCERLLKEIGNEQT